MSGEDVNLAVWHFSAGWSFSRCGLRSPTPRSFFRDALTSSHIRPSVVIPNCPDPPSTHMPQSLLRSPLGNTIRTLPARPLTARGDRISGRSSDDARTGRTSRLRDQVPDTAHCCRTPRRLLRLWSEHPFERFREAHPSIFSVTPPPGFGPLAPAQGRLAPTPSVLP